MREKAVNWLGFFRNLDGRIGRKSFWLWSFAIGATLVVGMVTTLWTAVSFSTDVRWIASWWVQLILILLFYPQFVVDVKRGHDRNIPTWVIAAYFALMIGQQVLPRFGLLVLRPGQSMLSPGSMVYWTVMALFVISSIVLFVQLGFLRGTRGPNRFGSDPLARGELRGVQSAR
jgi:uncharacterized membrane protein YhaH (DUF805 family)